MKRTRTTFGIIAVIAATALVSGCTAGGSGGDAGDGVAHGASKADWISAFEDVDPITLHTQVLYAKGDLNNTPYTDYYDRIEECLQEAAQASGSGIQDCQSGRKRDLLHKGEWREECRGGYMFCEISYEAG